MFSPGGYILTCFRARNTFQPAPEGYNLLAVNPNIMRITEAICAHVIQGNSASGFHPTISQEVVRRYMVAERRA
jgi:hypothetical protein